MSFRLTKHAKYSTRLLLRFLLLSVSLILTLVAADFVTGLVYQPEIFNISYEDHRFSENPVLVYEHVPGQGSINSKGMRDYEVEYEKPAGIQRIAVLGDSITYGMKTDMERTYPKALERRLRDSGVVSRNQTIFQVLNFGVRGYSLIQEVEVLRVKALKFDPDYVILGYFINDETLFSWDLHWLSKVMEQRNQEFFINRYNPGLNLWQKMIYRSNLGTFLLARLDTIRDKSWFQCLKPDQINNEVLAAHYKTRDILGDSFKAMKELLDPVGVDCLVVLLPENLDFDDYPHSEQNARVIRYADQFGFSSLDMVDYIRSHHAGINHWDLFVDSCHLTPQGHALVAQAIFGKLQEMGVIL